MMLDTILIGLDALHTLGGEAVARVTQEPDATQHSSCDEGLECVELEVALTACHSHCGVVTKHLHAKMCDVVSS